MKKLLIACMVLVSNYMISQVFVEGVDINQTKVKKCQIVGTSKLLSNKVTIAIDYGQDRKFFSQETRITDKDKKDIIFNSMVDALNFLEENGWVYVDAYVLTTGNQNVYHYLLSRKIE